MVLCSFYGMCGTERAYGAMTCGTERAYGAMGRAAVSGTDMGYGAGRRWFRAAQTGGLGSGTP
eukprot:3934229-Rhodomonas_salina.1